MARLLRTLDEFPDDLRGGAIAIGNFDGVHQGHAGLVEQLKGLAKCFDGPAVILTFDPPPVAILVPDRLPSAPLTSMARRAELLGRLGVDAMVAYPTDRNLLNLSPAEFFQQKIVRGLGARAMVEGPNFRFGKDRVGNIELLRSLCEASSVTLEIAKAKQDESGVMISSSRIREALAEGDLKSVNTMLTQFYQITGIVAKGAQRGRELGFPTANLEDIANLLPAFGVYAGQVELEGSMHAAAVNIGPNPTFGEQRSKVEVHILDWKGTIYGERLEVTLLKRIREVRKFDCVDSLTQQLQQDIQACRGSFSAAPGKGWSSESRILRDS